MAKYRIEFDRELCIGALACTAVAEKFWPRADDGKVDLANAAYNEETKKWEWRWIHDTLNASTDLDPYFYDPYYFGEAQLTWGANMIKEANTLLDKGSKYRDWDWMLPFFIGFNHFYFLQENDKASEYLMTASKRPGGSSMFASLATRLAYKGQRTENAILFIEQMLKEEKNESVREEFETRLEALKGILLLERSVIVYKDRFGIAPFSLNDLITAGIFAKLPEDPYGGEFYIALESLLHKTFSLLKSLCKNPAFLTLFKLFALLVGQKRDREIATAVFFSTL